MTQAHKPSPALEDAALILLGLAQAAVLTSWGISSATGAVKSLGFGVSEDVEHSRFSKGVKIAGAVGFGALVVAAFMKRRAARAREEAVRQIPFSRTMPATRTAEMH